MSDTTSILDLPSDPVSNSATNNISLSVGQNNDGGVTSSFSLDQSTISQIVNGLQQASLNGATQLSSRDIPMSSSSHTTDPYIQPNYVPPTPTQSNNDYISMDENAEDMIHSYKRNFEKNQYLDDIYNEIQLPLLIIIIYFLFQLPFFKKILFQYLPILFSSDGNFNMNGYVFTSILYGFVFYLLNKVSTHFGTF